MKRTLLVAGLLLMLVLPVLAGHTTTGNWCECGTPGCICDPGELGGSSRPLPMRDQEKLGAGTSLVLMLRTGLMRLTLPI